MTTVLGVALAAVVLSLTAALAYALLTSWRRMLQDEAPLPVFAMLDRRQVGDREDLESEALAIAARRCAFCGRKQECRAWLASAKSESCPPYCPNAGLFQG